MKKLPCLKYYTFASIDPGVGFLVWRVNERIIWFIRFDEISNGFDGSR